MKLHVLVHQCSPEFHWHVAFIFHTPRGVQAAPVLFANPNTTAKQKTNKPAKHKQIRTPYIAEFELVLTVLSQWLL
jgi:hypothetical protein